MRNANKIFRDNNLNINCSVRDILYIIILKQINLNAIKSI